MRWKRPQSYVRNIKLALHIGNRFLRSIIQKYDGRRLWLTNQNQVSQRALQDEKWQSCFLFSSFSLLCHCIYFMLSTDPAESKRAEAELWWTCAVPISGCLIECKRQQPYRRHGTHHSSQLRQENRFNLSALETLTLIVKITDTSIQ